MKRVRKIITSLGAAALAMVLGLNFNACSEQSPLSPANDSGSLKKGIRILRYQESSTSALNKVVGVSQMITVQDGGQLYIDATNTNGSRIQVTLDVAAGSISRDALLSMALEDEMLIVGFDIPDGVTFSEAPELSIIADGLPSGNFSTVTLNVYVYSNGQWQALPGGSVLSSGRSLTGGGRLSGGVHINSRYAIGAE